MHTSGTWLLEGGHHREHETGGLTRMHAAERPLALLTCRHGTLRNGWADADACSSSGLGIAHVYMPPRNAALGVGHARVWTQARDSFQQLPHATAMRAAQRMHARESARTITASAFGLLPQVRRNACARPRRDARERCGAAFSRAQHIVLGVADSKVHSTDAPNVLQREPPVSGLRANAYGAALAWQRAAKACAAVK